MVNLVAGLAKRSIAGLIPVIVTISAPPSPSDPTEDNVFGTSLASDLILNASRVTDTVGIAPTLASKQLLNLELNFHQLRLRLHQRLEYNNYFLEDLITIRK